MSIYYFDASALVKYYILEPGSTWVRQLIDGQDEQAEKPLHTIIIADMTIAEVSAAFAVLNRVRRLRKKAWYVVFDRFMNELIWRYRLAGTNQDDFFEAALLTLRHPLRAYDAVQLAVAMRQKQALTALKQSLIFVAGDNTLLAAAQAEGLTTDNPFDTYRRKIAQRLSHPPQAL